jgi:hypothetical protein
LAVSGNSTFDTTTLVVDAAGDRVILGAAASLEGDTIVIHAKGNAGQFLFLVVRRIMVQPFL